MVVSTRDGEADELRRHVVPEDIPQLNGHITAVTRGRKVKMQAVRARQGSRCGVDQETIDSTALAAVQTPLKEPEINQVQEKCRFREIQPKRSVRRKAETPPGTGLFRGGDART